MSKSNLKKLLATMSKEHLIKLIGELYDARKEAKEYLEYYLSPDEKGKAEEYKDIIKREFYSKDECIPSERTSFAVCRKAISDFKKLKPSPEYLADVMLFYSEIACKCTFDFGDMWEAYYTSVENNFRKTLQYIVDNNLYKKMKPRIKQCLEWSEGIGWGFEDTMNEIFFELVDDDDE